MVSPRKNRRLETERLMLATIYSDNSQECERIVSLVKSLHAEFTVYKLNHHFTQRAFEDEFGEGATYPQITIGAKHIGNLKETLQHLQKQGALSSR